MAKLNQDKWQEWMIASLDGNKNTYRLLLCELRIWLFGYFRTRVHEASIEDLIQDTLLTIHNKRASFDTSRILLPWIIAIARNKLIDKYRRSIKMIEVELDFDLQDTNSPENCAREDIEKLLKLIPQNQANIISMIKIQELSIEEVALKTGLSQSNVKISVHRGLKALQSKVKEVINE